MIRAFEQLGYEVVVICGRPWQRWRLFKQLRLDIVRNRHQYQFVYAETASLPNALTGRHHLPLLPNVDSHFLQFCHRQGLKIGLFYRDIYWNVPQIFNVIPRWKRLILKYFFQRDLARYQQCADVLYVPHLNMARHIPLKDFKGQLLSLPPGALCQSMPVADMAKGPLRLLYVGGVGRFYQLQLLLEAVALLSGQQVRLDICCRHGEWQQYIDQCQVTLADNIVVHHLSQSELQPLYQQADIACLFIEPHFYRTFAMPIKLFEYIGYGKPIIASQGTAAGDFIAEQEVGWVLPYRLPDLIECLQRLISQPSLVIDKAARVSQVQSQHSWQARARQVERDLSI